jgi:hypothetical protein
MAASTWCAPTLVRLPWRRSAVSATLFPELRTDVPTFNFSGFLIYTHPDLDVIVTAFCAGLEGSCNRIAYE